MIVIFPDEVCHLGVKPDDVPQIVSTTLARNKAVEPLLYIDPESDRKTVHEGEIAFHKRQSRIVLGLPGA